MIHGYVLSSDYMARHGLTRIHVSSVVYFAIEVKVSCLSVKTSEASGLVGMTY